ncbi:hypothetical protein [Litorisediminicola beolgyonensis]|uniref:Asparagine synthetase domain-containing protein n=1 Tax=Litorisediminicola beolgyonensis TaxID=1173614 RepID=A0ABW3ZCB8_9RHOB
MRPFCLTLDSWTGLPAGAVFDGYAFQGADVILGAEGFAEVAPRFDLPADGAFVLARPRPDGWEIAADAAGYRHVFWWRNGRDWAVSESFLELVSRLRARGVALRLDPGEMGAWLGRRQLFEQLTTRATCVAGISVLGRDETLRIGPEGMSVRQTPRLAAETYPDGLRAFLETWLGRLAALRAADMPMRVHLSGGVDSRAIAALHLWLDRQLGPHKRCGLFCSGGGADREVAERVAAETGAALNALGNPPRIAIGPEAALAAWEARAVGAYAPVRLYPEVQDPDWIELSGHGGGGYKQPLSPGAVRRQVWLMTSVHGFYGMGDRWSWKRGFEAQLARLAPEPGPAWMRWQRASRARFHGAQALVTRSQVSPFDSLSAEAAGDARRGPQMRARQMHYDIMASLAPDLLDLPFDSAAKAPDAQHRAALTRIDRLELHTGRVFGRLTPPEPGAPGPDPLRLVLERVDTGLPELPSGAVNHWFRRELRQLGRMIRSGASPRPKDMRHLHSGWLMLRLMELGVTGWPGGET